MKKKPLQNAEYKLLLQSFREWLQLLNYSPLSIPGLSGALKEFLQYQEQNNKSLLQHLAATDANEFIIHLQNKTGERTHKALRVHDELGINLRVAQGLRTLQEQDNLYRIGRDGPNDHRPPVTNARGGQSYHNFGLAIDIYVVINGRVDFNRVVPPQVVEIARQEGFEWGGNWRRFRDYPHFQMTFEQTLEQLRIQHGIRR